MQQQQQQQQGFQGQQVEEYGKEKGRKGGEEIEDMWTPEETNFEMDGDFWEAL